MARVQPSGRSRAIWASAGVGRFPRSYNQKVGLALFCPITSQVKGYPFEVMLPREGKAPGAILSDQIKSLDWRARKAKRLSKAPRDVTMEVLAKIRALIDDDS